MWSNLTRLGETTTHGPWHRSVSVRLKSSPRRLLNSYTSLLFYSSTLLLLRPFSLLLLCSYSYALTLLSFTHIFLYAWLRYSRSTLNRTVLRNSVKLVFSVEYSIFLFTLFFFLLYFSFSFSFQIPLLQLRGQITAALSNVRDIDLHGYREHSDNLTQVNAMQWHAMQR